MADNTNSASPAEFLDETEAVRLSGTLNLTGGFFLGDLPTSDPAVIGQAYNNSGVVTISTGP